MLLQLCNTRAGRPTLPVAGARLPVYAKRGACARVRVDWMVSWHCSPLRLGVSGQPFSNPVIYLFGQCNADVLQRRAAHAEGERGRQCDR